MDNLLTPEEIDNIRFKITNAKEDAVDKVWWDVCSAYEKMHGIDDSIRIEQVLINGRFLVEGMKAFDKDDLTIWFSGDTGPVVIGGKGFKHLMLPIKLA